MAKGIAIASPRSGEGKTMLAMGIIAALNARGVRVCPAKCGPDYIDAQFLTAAAEQPCLSLDSWAMHPDCIRSRARVGEDLLIIEGAMGLHDGAPDPSNPAGRGSTADLTRILNVPVVLVLDVARQAQTAAAIVKGLREFASGTVIPGVILNRVGSERHRASIERALSAQDCPVIGAFPQLRQLDTPSRHLGLVQARERADLQAFIAEAGSLAAEYVDLDRFCELSSSIRDGTKRAGIPPLGQHVAVARDEAFSFLYEHLLVDWRRAGTEISFFSPLADEPPARKADAIYLPGGYPELHAARLASSRQFRAGVRAAAARGATVYGECGGYMTLGQSLIDSKGCGYEMLGLLPVETSFEAPRMRLGYRYLRPYPNPVWPQISITGHEFHYAQQVGAEDAARPLFAAWDSQEARLPDMGIRVGRIMGSFAHVIDCR